MMSPGVNPENSRHSGHPLSRFGLDPMNLASLRLSRLPHFHFSYHSITRGASPKKLTIRLAL